MGKEEKGNKEQMRQEKTNNKMIHLKPTIEIITLEVNGLISLIKRQRLSDWIKIVRCNYMLHSAYRYTSEIWQA